MLINLLMIIFFSTVTLLLLGGFSRKNIGAIISTLITTSLIYVLYKLTIEFTGDLHYELMDYIAGPNDIENIYQLATDILYEEYRGELFDSSSLWLHSFRIEL